MISHVNSGYMLTTHIQACVAEIQEWIGMNKLKFNVTKTEIIVDVCATHQEQSFYPHIEIDNTIVPISTFNLIVQNRV